LNSYADFEESSLQYRWLEKDLARFDRKKTPWLFAMMHVPWYNSNQGHFGEGKLMRESMESLLYKKGANVILNGHVHSYERTWPMFRNATDPCGPTYLNLGDGGNREGPYGKWYPGKDGKRLPDWSAFRQGSFGVGKMNMLNATHIHYIWNRHACWDNSPFAARDHENYDKTCSSTGDQSHFATHTVDEMWIVRPAHCTNQL